MLLTTSDQLASALALIELDGVASRIIVCPPDIGSEQFPSLIARGAVDAIVSDEMGEDHYPDGLPRVTCGQSLTQADVPETNHETEWVLLTSGTTGRPKMIGHTLASLCAPIGATRKRSEGVVWGTFYDIRRYGGLQILLRALLTGTSMIMSSAAEPVSDHLDRLAGHGVTHLLGTPSHWRRALMSPHMQRIAPKYVRLSGEISDQAILNALVSYFPGVPVTHAFATTEAGVAFEVNDGMAGFPAKFLGARGDVEMKVANDSLRIRSDRRASRYLSGENGALADEDGFVDTGDILELRGDRYFFLGRRNGVINVGGLKVYPEEVEAVINRHPAVRMSAVGSRRNPLTGALVSAQVVLSEAQDAAGVKSEILEICRLNLAAYKIPATIRCVPALDLAPAGKMSRSHA